MSWQNVFRLWEEIVESEIDEPRKNLPRSPQESLRNEPKRRLSKR